MGNDYSTYVQEAAKMESNVCVIYVLPGVLYGINLPDVIINGIQAAYLDVWKKPILKVKNYNPNIIKISPHKFIMFQGDNASNSVKVKQMFCRFHKLFCANGWSLANSPTLTFRCSLSSWFYHKELNPYLIDTGTIDNEFCAISLSGSASLQFADFPEELEQPMINCIKRTWSKGVADREEIENAEKTWSIHMKGFSWYGEGEKSLDNRNLVLTMIRFMSHQNWRLVNSTAMKSDACDTMFFRRFSNAFNATCPETMPEYYFMLALMNKNYFAMLGVNDGIKDTIASSCQKYDEKGVKSVEIRNNYPCIMMNDDVWSRRDFNEVYNKRLLTLIFQDLAAIGWLPVESIDVSRSIKDLSSIVFVSIPPLRMMFFSLSPTKHHEISLVNAPDEVKTLIYNTFVKYYPIEKETTKMVPTGISSTIKFSGDVVSGENRFGSILFQQALALVIEALKEDGWYLILSADSSNETISVGSGNDRRVVKYSIYSLWFGKVLPP